jgi:virginiamycin A acetyltransferase
MIKYTLKKIRHKLSRLKRAPHNVNIIESKLSKRCEIDPLAVVQYSELRCNVKVGPRSLINKVLFDGPINIGSNTTINGPGTEFYAHNHSINIGNFCSIARGTAIQEHNHDAECITTYFIKKRVFNDTTITDVVSKGEINIGSDVWIGTQSVILTGVTIGDGAIIAANSVVNQNVPPYAIVGGTPAKVIKYRFNDEIIKRLLELKWWDWEIDRIKRNKHLFYEHLTLELLDHVVL